MISLAVCALALNFVSSTHGLEKSFVSAGHRLVYEAAGKGKPIVILAGGPGLDAEYMRAVFDLAKDQGTAILFHQWGTGKSPIDPKTAISEKTINIRTAVADLEALRKNLGVSKLTFVGHSWGGMLAQAFAAAHPERTGKLVLLDSGGPDRKFQEAFSDNLRMRLTDEDLAEMNEASKIEDAEKRAVAQLVAMAPGYFYSRKTALKMKEGEFAKLRLNRLVFQPLMKFYDVTPTLGKYKGPCSLIQGRQDPIDAATAFQIKALLPQTKLTWIEQCGHFPWIEQPAVFKTALRKALS